MFNWFFSFILQTFIMLLRNWLHLGLFGIQSRRVIKAIDFQQLIFYWKSLKLLRQIQIEAQLESARVSVYDRNVLVSLAQMLDHLTGIKYL